MLAPKTVCLCLPLVLVAGAMAGDLPALQPGMWQYQRTLAIGERGKPQIASVRKCSDPSAEFEQKLAQLKQKGCVFTPIRHNGERYEASWRCPAPDGSIVAMRDVITVTGHTSYRNESEARSAHQVTHTTIVATRQGDCPTAAGRQSSVALPAVSSIKE
jgi:hypothetical protein